MWELLKTGERFRALGKTDGFRLLRWGPMAVADLVAEWFETDLLQAAIAARGDLRHRAGTVVGRHRRGAAAERGDRSGAGRQQRHGQGRPRRADRGDGRRRARSGRRDPHGRGGRAHRRPQTAAPPAWSSRTAPRSPRTRVVSSADPRRTFLDLVDPVELDPGFLTKIRNYRCRGTVAKVNLALGGLPAFPGVAESRRTCAAACTSVPGSTISSARSTRRSTARSPREPYLDVAFPSLVDPSLAPPGRHVMSVYVQFAPYKLARGTHLGPHARSASQRSSCGRSSSTRRASARSSKHSRCSRRLDLERTYGLTGGHIHHGEPSLDQLFTMRPVLGWARYRTPIDGLFLCGSGTHPGGGITGGVRTERRARDREGASRVASSFSSQLPALRT